jgi:DNA-binding NarL/FixJ family response regulator
MPMITRQERERLVLDLYNQGKTIREIAKEEKRLGCHLEI